MFKKPCYSDNYSQSLQLYLIKLGDLVTTEISPAGKGREFSSNWWFLTSRNPTANAHFQWIIPKIKDHKIPAGNSDFVELQLFFFPRSHGAMCHFFCFTPQKPYLIGSIDILKQNRPPVPLQFEDVWTTLGRNEMSINLVCAFLAYLICIYSEIRLLFLHCPFRKQFFLAFFLGDDMTDLNMFGDIFWRLHVPCTLYSE